jgi:hypothetical protein
MAARFSLPRPDEPGTSAHPLPPAPLDGRWRRSSFSTGSDTTCVEVALGDPGLDDPGLDDAELDERAVLLRDSKDPAGPVLRFTAAEWRVFLRGVLAGEFALPEPGHRSSSSRAASSADDASGSAAIREATAKASV